MNIAVFGNIYQDNHIDAINGLLEALMKQDVTIVAEKHFYQYIETHLPEETMKKIVRDDSIEPDIVLSIGGDGTFLKTAAKIGEREIPIFGINSGHLGFLAGAQIDEYEEVAKAITSKNFMVEDRTLLEVSVDRDVRLPKPFALNEVAIQKNTSASMLSMHTEINGSQLSTYHGDGMIVATPTGSTAYNLSVGGPIVHPACGCWVISPNAAHSLTMRPVVVPDNLVVKITTSSQRSSDFRLSVDGESVCLPIGTTITLRKAKHVVKVAQHVDYLFSRTLRNKLMWGADPR